LEFSVGARQNNWEVKELMQDHDHMNDYQDSDYGGSMYHLKHRGSAHDLAGY